MLSNLRAATFCILFLGVGAAAQTVTGSGTSGYVPVFTGTAGSTSSTIGNSGTPIVVGSSSDVGIGTTAPATKVHVADTAKVYNSVNNEFDSNVEIQGNYAGKAIGQGPALGFLAPANTDGSNPWEMGRILVSPDSTTTGQAYGRMYLQTRGSLSAWTWNNNLVLTSAGSVGIGTTAPAHPLDVNGQVNATGYCISGTNCITAWPIVSGVSQSNGEVSSITFADGTVQSTAVGSSQGCTGGDGVSNQPAGATVAGLVLNVICLKNNEADTRSYQIATLPASATTTADHLHVLVDANYTWGSQGHSYIDAFFANRNGFSYQYTVRGAPVTGNSTIQAYQNSNGTVTIYLVLAANAYAYTSYTVLENIQETVYASPANVGATPPGTLVFDSSSPNYPPVTFMGFNGNVGIGTNTPAAKLQVIGNVSAIGQAYIGENTNGTAVIDAYNGDAFFGDNGAANGIAVNPSGNVGIGTSTPAYKLDVEGGSINSSGGYCIGGSCITSWPTSSANTWSGTQTFSGNLSLPGSGVWTTNGNVGIGTTSPVWKLTVGSGLSSSVDNTITEEVLNTLGVSNPDSTSLFINSTETPLSGTEIGSYKYSSSAWQPLTLSASKIILGSPSRESGNVGIGTAAPSAKLEVNGSVTLTAGSGASITYSDGTTQSTAWNGVLSGGDYAESVNVSGNREEYEPGDVLVIDPTSEGNFLRSSTPYSTAVTGIYSTKPGVVGRRQLSARAHMTEEVPMAMTGIVPTRVTTENGPIKPGDLLVTSSRSGYAMKGTDRSQMLGAVIGKAVGHLGAC